MIRNNRFRYSLQGQLSFLFGITQVDKGKERIQNKCRDQCVQLRHLLRHEKPQQWVMISGINCVKIRALYFVWGKQ